MPKYQHFPENRISARLYVLNLTTLSHIKNDKSYLKYYFFSINNANSLYNKIIIHISHKNTKKISEAIIGYKILLTLFAKKKLKN